ncbi:TM2 domain-containing protein [Rarobacter incanus]|uniref:TM2 domain-containing protein n=1 Tax=Rarobacter incanus TaxID=153494 RepID=A0A542SPS4_9MICO|nr:TM2 domain-containing protein [Rarobacter incanus]TQK76592.1 TM2 domain-containing protein [Rarobacter incanus]
MTFNNDPAGQQGGYGQPQQPFGQQSNPYGTTQQNYGAPQSPYGAPAPEYNSYLANAYVSDKTFIVTWLLSLLLGSWGIDRFYLGKIGTGVLKLITGGGLGIWALIDLIIILTGNMRDSNGRSLAGYEENKRTAIIVTVALFAVSIVSTILMISAGMLTGIGAYSSTSV